MKLRYHFCCKNDFFFWGGGAALRPFGTVFQSISGRLPERGRKIGWLVGCFGFNGPLRQYFSLYRAVSQREGERLVGWLVVLGLTAL